MTKSLQIYEPKTQTNVVKKIPHYLQYTDSGNIKIADTWIGPKSGLSFYAKTEDNKETEICIWLDSEKTVPFRAFCVTQNILVETVSMFDTVFSFATKHTFTKEDLQNISNNSLKISHILMLLQFAGIHTRQAIEQSSPGQMNSIYLNALKTYDRIEKRLDNIFNTHTPNNILEGLKREKNEFGYKRESRIH